jgi:ABC-type branched-subunit amino acid transport system substrate-binding protein
MKKCFFSAILMITVIVFGMSGTAGAAAEEMTLIPVAIISPLSGPAGPWGQTGMPIYAAFMPLFNKEGFRVNGKLYGFKHINYDSLNTPEGAAAATKRAIFEDHVKFIIGHWDATFTTTQAIAMPEKVIMFTRNGNEAVKGGGGYDPEKMPYVVFATPAQEMYINDVKAIVKAYPKYKKIGLGDSTLGKGIGTEYVDAALAEVGIRMHREWWPEGTTDFSPYITRFKEAGCDIIMNAGGPMATMLLLKQRWAMGLKHIKIASTGGMLNPNMYYQVSGKDAAEGLITEDGDVTILKKTKINPKDVTLFKDTMALCSKNTGKTCTYTDWSAYGPTHLEILAQAMQKAGTVDDPDKIMKEIRGGTFDTMVGKYTMSGAKTYGSPIVFGNPGLMGQLKGGKSAYLGESSWTPVP